MIFASGFVEADEAGAVEKVVKGLAGRGITVNETKEEKVVFLIERETLGEVKSALESLRDIDGVRNVYLAYFSLEDGDREPGTSFFEAG